MNEFRTLPQARFGINDLVYMCDGSDIRAVKIKGVRHILEEGGDIRIEYKIAENNWVLGGRTFETAEHAADNYKRVLLSRVHDENRQR